MPTMPRVKNVKATPNERKDSWSINLESAQFIRLWERYWHSLSFLSETKGFTGDVADYPTYDTGQRDLV
jgi:hypothetical protein